MTVLTVDGYPTKKLKLRLGFQDQDSTSYVRNDTRCLLPTSSHKLGLPADRVKGRISVSVLALVFKFGDRANIQPQVSTAWKAHVVLADVSVVIIIQHNDAKGKESSTIPLFATAENIRQVCQQSQHESET